MAKGIAGLTPELRKTDALALRRKDAVAFRLIFAIAFTAFLLEAIGRRLFMRNPRMSAQAGHRKSVIAEAHAAAWTVVPFAFMG